MSLKTRLVHALGRRMFERPAQRLALAEHAAALRDSGETTLRTLGAQRPTPRHLAKLRHVIGIERWGQRRLRVLLGEPFVAEGHRPYLPPEDRSWEALLEEFRETREETVRLADSLRDRTSAGRVAHDQFGELSARGWLRYLKGHAEFETRRLR